MIDSPRERFQKFSAALAGLLLGAAALPASAQLEDLGNLDAVGDVADLGAAVETAQEALASIEIRSEETSFDESLGIAKASGNVEIIYGNTIIRADRAEYHQSTGDVFARDNVIIFKDGATYTAEEAIYNINTGEMTATAIRSSLEPIYYDAGELELQPDETDVIEMQNSWFTTHDSANPNYRIKAKSIKIYPGDKIVFRNLKFYTGDVPILWLPYLSQPLDDELGYYFTPGYNSAWGAFLLNRYGFLIGDHTLAQTHLDLRSERGVAGGISLFSERYRDQDNFGSLKLYYADDLEPNQGFNGEPRGTDIDSERYRVNLQHRVYLPGPEESSLYVDIDINKVSDEFFYNDFFPAEFRIDPRPDNIVNLVKSHPRGAISLLGRFQLNDFFATDTRLPELAADFTRQPIFDTGLFYQGSTSYGILEEHLGDPERENLLNQRNANRDILRGIERGDFIVEGNDLVDPDGNLLRTDFDMLATQDLLDSLDFQLQDRGFNRFHTYHEVLYPETFGGVLQVVPRTGVGYTNYSSVNGPNSGSFDRTIFHAGLDTSVKFSRVYGAHNPALGIDEIRHIFQPYINYSFTSADQNPNGFAPIDRLTPSTRLRPIDVPLFTAVDSIQDWNIVRTGMYNRFQTKRNGGTHAWLDMNTYFEHYIDDPEFDRDFSNLFQEAVWSPLPWLSASTRAQLPVFGEELEFTEVNSGLNFMPTRNFQFGVGHFFLQDHPFFIDSSLVSFNTYTRLSDDWGFSTVHRFEAEDSTLEIQQYQLHRDLSSWTASIGGIIRDNRGETDEYGIVLSFTLKAFPKLTVPIDFEPAGGNVQ